MKSKQERMNLLPKLWKKTNRLLFLKLTIWRFGGFRLPNRFYIFSINDIEKSSQNCYNNQRWIKFLVNHAKQFLLQHWFIFYMLHLLWCLSLHMLHLLMKLQAFGNFHLHLWFLLYYFILPFGYGVILLWKIFLTFVI